MVVRSFLLLAFVLGCSLSHAEDIAVSQSDNKSSRPVEETITIPLDGVWAHEMPGTRDVNRLQPFFFSETYANLPPAERLRLSRESDIRGIIEAIDVRPEDGPEEGFAVQGSGAEALSEALAVLTTEESPRQLFLSGSDISLFFFSYELGSCVHLTSIKRLDKTFEIEYVFVPHMQATVTEHFAIIPAGDLSPGQYKVNIKLGKDAHLLKDPKDGFACLPFIFTVTDTPTE